MTRYRITFSQRRARFLVCLVSLLVALISSKHALAHAALVRTEPADGATLSVAPQEYRLWFNETIAPRFSVVQLLNAQGQPVPGLDFSAVPTDPSALLVRLPQLPAGAYTLIWKALSEADGHFSQGMVLFGVNVAAPNAPAVKFTTVDAPLIEVVLRWLNFGSLAAIVGALAILLLLYRPGWIKPQPEQAIYWQTAQQRIWRLVDWSVLSALLIGIALLLRQLWIVQQTGAASADWGSAAWSLVSQTRWGELWVVREIVLLLLLSLLRIGRGSAYFLRTARWFGCLVLILCLALLSVQALTGHAAGNIRNAWLAVPMTVLHLLAASLWVGGLLALAVGWLPWLVRPQENRLALLQMGFQPFSRLAALSVGVLVATGLYNSGQQVPSLDAFLLTAYGWFLLGKIGLVLLVGGIGLLNSLLLHPSLATWLARRLGRPLDWRPVVLQRLPLLVLTEVAAGAFVLLLTGVLTASAPPRGVIFTLSPESERGTMTQTVDDLQVALDIKPNRPGQNVIRVQTLSKVDPPPAKIMRVLVRFTYQDSDFGRVSAKMEEIESGSYLLNGNDLKLAGPWQIDVVTRRLGIEDSVAHFNWVVPPSGPLPPTVLSKRPLATPFTIASLVILLLVAWTGFALRWRVLLHFPARLFTVVRQPRFSDQRGSGPVYPLPASETNSLISE